MSSDLELVGSSNRCNRQLASSELLNRPSDVTRSTVQMAVVVLARQPVFVSLILVFRFLLKVMPST